MSRILGQRGGSSSIEAVILAPALMLFLGIIIATGRIGLANITVNSAAGSAARAASIERTAGAANTAAHTVIAADLAHDGLRCNPAVTVDTAGVNAPLGQTGQVQVAISCTVPLADLAVPGMPGTVTLTGTGAAVVDPFRERGSRP